MNTMFAKIDLEALGERCRNDEHLRDNPDYDGHRRLIESAIVSSNGAPDKLGAMAATQGQLVAFIVTQALREPARMKLAFEAVHVCPVAGLTTTDGEGRKVYPWERREATEAKRTGFGHWLMLLLPYRWPIALICFSPFAAEIFSKALAAFK